MATVRGYVVRATRSLFGLDNPIERFIRSVQHRIKYQTRGFVRTTTACVFKGDPDRRIGLYSYSGCDTWAIADAGPLLKKVTGATGGIFAQGRADFTRSDLILQAREGVAPEFVEEMSERLGGKAIMFTPTLFEEEFTIPAHRYAGSFKKDIVVLSMSSDLSRVVYRHKTNGFLIDPGGFWLAGDLADALPDPDVVKWVNKHFEKVGRISLDEAISNYRKIIRDVRSSTQAHVVMFNSLTVDPGRRVLDYKLAHSPHRTRRRQFASALVELARELDFSIVDVDRIVKGIGVQGMGDFVKLTPRHKRAVGAELIRVLKDREVL